MIRATDLHVGVDDFLKLSLGSNYSKDKDHECGEGRREDLTLAKTRGERLILATREALYQTQNMGCLTPEDQVSLHARLGLWGQREKKGKLQSRLYSARRRLWGRQARKNICHGSFVRPDGGRRCK